MGTTIYQDLDIEPIINAAGTITTLGGSLMPTEVIRAMEEASRCFVDMRAFHLRAGDRIATLVGAEEPGGERDRLPRS